MYALRVGSEKRSEHDFGELQTNVSIQIELGTACGKLFRCSTMAILDAGDSDILTTNTEN